MPIVLLEPGNSVPLSKCADRDPMLETTIANPNKTEGRYVISYDLMPLSVQYTIGPEHRITICSPAGTIQNDGDVNLDVTTPGL